MLYSYVVVDSMNLHEMTGVIESRSVHEAILNLQTKGYLVREIRRATANDIQLARLKNFRSRIDPDKTRMKLKEAKPTKIPRSFSWHLFFVFVVIVLIVIFLVLEEYK